MDNNANSQNIISFDSLKKLNSLLSSSELSSFVTSINKSKLSLDNFCKVIKEKESKLKSSSIEISPKTIEVIKEKAPQVVVEKPSNITNTNIDNTLNNTNTIKNKFNSGDNKNLNNNYVPNYQRQNNADFNNNKNYNNQPKFQNYRNNNFNKPNDNGYKKFNRDGTTSTTPYQSNFRKNENGQTGTFNKNFNGPRPFNKQPNEGGKFLRTNTFNKDNTIKPKPFIKIEKDEVLHTKPERTFGNKNKSKSNDNEKKELNIKAKIRMGYIELENFLDEDRVGRVRTKAKKIKQNTAIEKQVIDNAEINTDNLTVKILAEKIGKPATEIIKKFMVLGIMPNINSVIDYQTAELVASEFGVTLTKKVEKNFEEQLKDMYQEDNEDFDRRPPIVAVMGHVDHGKTSLLDAIRKTNVINTEAGGITQHIGAYSVDVNDKKITFIDTPGHEAFTAMRLRGAKVTDIAILVVAADDGIMPQTVEAINHIKSANVPMIVAINKIDKPDANIDRVKQQLTEYNVIPEEWGGDTICVPISAKNNLNIDKLLDTVLLVAEMQDLKCNKKAYANGYVIESKIDKGKGVVANIIISNGTLKIGQFMVCGISSGRVKALYNFQGKSIKEAGPSTPVSVIGFDEVPTAGDKAYVVDEKMAKNIIAERNAKKQIEKINQNNSISLESFLKQDAEHEIKTFSVIIKADVNGSAEALKQTIEKINNEEVQVKCVSATVGNINESDVLLADATNCYIIGFNTKIEAKAKALADKNKIKYKIFKIIYEAVDEITNIINGMLTPKFEDFVTGHAEIRQIFKISSKGNIAGCYVKDGCINKNSKIKVYRKDEVIFEGQIETLQQQKDEVKSVKFGFECGIKIKSFNDIIVGDIIEGIDSKQI